MTSQETLSILTFTHSQSFSPPWIHQKRKYNKANHEIQFTLHDTIVGAVFHAL